MYEQVHAEARRRWVHDLELELQAVLSHPTQVLGTEVLCKISKCCELLSHLSSPRSQCLVQSLSLTLPTETIAPLHMLHLAYEAAPLSQRPLRKHRIQNCYVQGQETLQKDVFTSIIHFLGITPLTLLMLRGKHSSP